MTTFIVIITLVVLAALIAQYMVLFTMRRMLRAGTRMVIEAAWKKVHTQESGILKVVEADKILDEALRMLGYTGSLGDKLKAAGARFKNLDAVWTAHKLRNKLVHELDTKPSDKEVDRAIDAFHKALTDLGARL